MIAIIWTYAPTAGAEARFRAAYGPDGDWAQLFRRAPGFVRTELLAEADGRYATLDYWVDAASFAAFMAAFVEDYAKLDAACEALTAEETRVGLFEVVA
jgi:heme-degrading monooxygenase HmoA